MVSIENELLRVVVDPQGAQLASIFRFENNREYLWQGSADSWANRATVLFPTVGRMRGTEYTVDGVTYSIPLHGFAKDMLFTVTDHTATSVTLTITDTPETLKMYPYHFKFSITYALDGNRIHKTHQVDNTQDTVLYYECGGHDGYNLPFNEGEVMNDCHTRIPGMDTLTPYAMDEAVTLMMPDKTYPLENGLIPLTPSTYGLDCMVLGNVPTRRVEIVDGKGTVQMSVEFPDMDFVTLWTKTVPFDTNFVCIEPWSSLPDGHFVGHELSEKVGVRRLEGGQSERLGYDIIIGQ